jgi:hypothetical protein
VARRHDLDDLISAAGIARELQLPRPQVVHAWRKYSPGFPPALYDRDRVVLFSWKAVEAWARKAGRLPG